MTDIPPFLRMRPPPGGLPDPEVQPEFYDWGPLKRFLAWVIDTLLTVALTAVAVVVFLLPLIGPFAVVVMQGLYVVVSLAYRTATLARFGATPGMAMAAIKLRRLDGSRPDAAIAFLHSLGYTLSVLFVFPQILSVVLMVVGRRGRGLSDLLLGTAVLNRAASV